MDLRCVRHLSPSGLSGIAIGRKHHMNNGPPTVMQNFKLCTLLLFTVFVAPCAGGCAIQPDVDGHVTIPSNWTSIPDSAFTACSSLSTITIPDSVTSIGNKGFAVTNLSTVTLPDSITRIGNEVFTDCQRLSTITIPNNVTSIGATALPSCLGFGLSLAQGNNPRGVVRCLPCENKTAIIIPDGVTRVGDRAFFSCKSVSTITFPNSVMSIGFSAFSRCSLLSAIAIPDSVTSIALYAFDSCFTLSTVTIPDSVTTIGFRAFKYCHNLSTITIPNNVTIGDEALDNCGCNKSLYVAGAKLCDCVTCPPTQFPTTTPTQFPTVSPTQLPTFTPTHFPTGDPSTSYPTTTPTQVPTAHPTQSAAPTTSFPTTTPTQPPTTSFPTTTPTQPPTDVAEATINANAQDHSVGLVSAVVVLFVIIVVILVVVRCYMIRSRRKQDVATPPLTRRTPHVTPRANNVTNATFKLNPNGDQDEHLYATLSRDRGPKADRQGYLVPVLRVAPTSTPTPTRAVYAYPEVDLRSPRTTDVSKY